MKLRYGGYRQFSDTDPEYAQKIQSLDGDNVSSAQHHRLELKIRELESKLDLEQTTRGRMETQINRLKEGVEKLNGDCDVARQRETSAQEEVLNIGCCNTLAGIYRLATLISLS